MECDEVLYSIFSMKHQLTFSSLHYAIEITANQNTGNPLYIRFDCVWPLYFLSYAIIKLCNALPWYTVEYLTSHLYFLTIYTRLETCVYTEKIQMNRAIFSLGYSIA